MRPGCDAGSGVTREKGGGTGTEVVFRLMCDCQEGLTKREDDLKETGTKSPLVTFNRG